MRCGVGPAFYRLSEMRIKSAFYVDDFDRLLEEFERINYWTFGMHVSIDATVDVTESVFLGGSIMIHFYDQGDLNHTMLLKLGFSL